MNKKITGLFILVCFCFAAAASFAVLKDSNNQEIIPGMKQSSPVSVRLLKLERYDYAGKEVYLKCRILQWAQSEYVVYDDADFLTMDNRVKNFKPKNGDEVLLKVKVVNKERKMLLNLLEGKVISPALITAKKGKLETIESEPFDILVLKVSDGEKYAVTGVYYYKLRDFIGKNIVAEGRIVNSIWDFADKAIDVVKYKVIK